MNKYVIIYKWWGDEEIYHQIVEANSELEAYIGCTQILDLLYDWEKEETIAITSMDEIDGLAQKWEMTFHCIEV